MGRLHIGNYLSFKCLQSLLHQTPSFMLVLNTSKYISISFLKVQEEFIKPIYTPFSQQLADIFTKPLGCTAHWFICFKLGLQSPCGPPIYGVSVRVIEGSHVNHTSNIDQTVADNKDGTPHADVQLVNPPTQRSRLT